MKTTLLSSLVGLALLVGCQSSNGASADSRTIDLPGTQARNTVTIPNSSTASTEAPNALRGNDDKSPAFNPDNYRSNGRTNGF